MDALLVASIYITHGDHELKHLFLATLHVNLLNYLVIDFETKKKIISL